MVEQSGGIDGTNVVQPAVPVMVQNVDWMQNVDYHLLHHIYEYGWVTPTTAYLNHQAGYAYGTVVKSLKRLERYGLIERHEEEAAYGITDLGRGYVDGDITAEELNEISPD